MAHPEMLDIRTHEEWRAFALSSMVETRARIIGIIRAMRNPDSIIESNLLGMYDLGMLETWILSEVQALEELPVGRSNRRISTNERGR